MADAYDVIMVGAGPAVQHAVAGDGREEEQS
jgi:hypothetical protein